MEFAFRRGSGRLVDQLSVEAVFDEFEKLATSEKAAAVWNLSDHCITPPFLKTLFQKINDSSCQPQGNLAIDLDANRLDNASVEDFVTVLKVLAKYERVSVRFGFEIFLPTLNKALVQMKMEDLFGTRVTVNIPWADRGVITLAFEQRKSNQLVEKRLASLESRKDPGEQLKQMKLYRDTDDRLIEEGVATAIAELLEDGKVVLTHYFFKGHVGELDALVVGRYDGQDVVVLVEAKHNMDTFHRKAKSELYEALKYWEKLVELSAEKLAEDTTLMSDYEQLCVAKYGSHSTMLAFGGAKFSMSVVQERFNKIRKPWFYVVANNSGKFSATHGKQLFEVGAACAD